MAEITLTRDELWALAYEIAGTATYPLLKDNPSYVFPSERVAGNVGHLLVEKGYGPAPRGYGSMLDTPREGFDFEIVGSSERPPSDL